MNEKGGKLNAETTTDEMLDSSRTVLQNYRGRGTRGLQQFFSPPQAADLVFNVFENVTTLDLTAGDGALLRRFPQELRFGVEIDPEQAAKGHYNAIVGDIQKVYPLARKMGLIMDAVALNPPFGLMWHDETFGGDINSTVLSYLYALQLIPSYGQGMLMAGHDRLIREIMPRKESKKIYAIIQVPDMFDNADILTAMAFFTHTPIEGEPWTHKCMRADLSSLSLSMDITKRRSIAQQYTTYTTGAYTLAALNEAFDALREEYQRRYSKTGKQAEYTIDMDTTLDVSLNPYQKIMLSNQSKLMLIEGLKGQTVNYFALNPKTWQTLKELEGENLITISPAAQEGIQEVIRQADKQICPLYPVKPQQRLGFLADVDQILCTSSDPEKEFKEGEKYPIDVRTDITKEHYIEQKLDKEGNPNEIHKTKERRLLRIAINETVFDESKEDIEYLIGHFDIPDPGDLVSRYPDAFGQTQTLLQSIEQGFDFTLKEFQREDLGRLLIKGSGLLSWEQGLGKTLGGLVFTEACKLRGAEDKALFIVPQDIIPQWQREAEKFFGRELTIIRSVVEARQAVRNLQNGGSGWYITYYEAVSRNGKAFKLLPEIESKVPHPRAGRDFYNHDTQQIEQHPEYHTISSKEFCPSCGEQAQQGKWYPRRGVCEECKYTHISLKVKPAYRHLTKAFKNGVIIIDEGTKIKGHDTLMSKSVRGLKARHKLLLTGTPIKNYVPDAFWPLWWALGNNSPRFPFNYANGAQRFAEEFAVIEYRTDRWGRKEGGNKILPEVSNLSILWRLLCSSIVRRRKEETGEAIVPRTFRPVVCPFGQQQKEMYEKWLYNFSSYFIATYPDKPISQYPELIDRAAAILGQFWKLEFASVLPEAEPSGYFSRSENWTPANLKVLELTQQHVQQGDKVLIGSDLMAYGRWIADQLNEKDDVQAVHITEQSKKTGKLQTKNPRKRAGLVHDFRNNGTNVLCASFNAMNLGHNLDMANVVILKGLPWDFATFDQFIARVHRLTSTKPVTVYVVLTEGSVDERKWQLLNEKSAAAQLALDGRLFEQAEERIDLQKILEELKEQGIAIKSNLVPENSVKRQWQEGALSADTGMTEKEKELLDKWNQVELPQRKKRKLKVPKNQLTLFDL